MIGKILLCLGLLLLSTLTNAFAVLPTSTTSSRSGASESTALRVDDTDDEVSSLTAPEQNVFSILEELHTSGFAFRVVVVGNGAILETTNRLGPKFKLGQSPASGKNIVTFASDDSSFEFHVMPADVSKIVFTEKESPVTGKTMRILRMINGTGKPICSLILAEQSKKAANWYSGVSEKYGPELQL